MPSAPAYQGHCSLQKRPSSHLRASGYRNVPGIYNKEQIAAWKKITDGVHAKGSFIWCQLWALGRAAQPDVLREQSGDRVVSSSNIPIAEGRAVPEPLTEEEIWGFIGDYAAAASNAVKAGFDGVEIHGANGLSRGPVHAGYQ